MSDNMKDFGKWTWYTLMFLQHCDQTSSNSSSIVESFIKNSEFNRENNFKPINQATILMGLYGLFVVPKEFWRNQLGYNNQEITADEIIEETFNFNPRNFFIENLEYTRNMKLSTFMRKFRNSLAHAQFEIDKKKNLFIFRNYNKDNKLDFEVSSDMIRLSQFMTKIGKFYINEIS